MHEHTGSLYPIKNNVNTRTAHAGIRVKAWTYKGLALTSVHHAQSHAVNEQKPLPKCYTKRKVLHKARDASHRSVWRPPALSYLIRQSEMYATAVCCVVSQQCVCGVRRQAGPAAS